MLTFLKNLTTRKIKAAEKNGEIYRRLVGKLAAGDDLNAADTAAMETALDALGIASADVEADVAALKESASLEAVAATVESARAASKAASVSFTAVQNGYLEKFKRINAEVAEAQAARTKALEVCATANRAAETLAQLRKNHPRVWGPLTTPDEKQPAFA